jgi:sugar O-acyltransferase (sialic acid O-acetyltransferase NeuD family)
MRDLVIYGAGGFGKEVACLVNSINNIKKTWNFLGFVDDGLFTGSGNEYGFVLGGISYLQQYQKELDVVLAIANTEIRKKLVDTLNNDELCFPNIIATDVLFLDHENLKIGKGNIIGIKCSISCNVTIGDFNIFNSNINIGHDTSIGYFNSFMTGTIISGEVNIGEGNYFGLLSAILQRLKVGNNVRISAGSVIIRNTQDNNLYVGNPAVKMKF